MSRRGKDAVQRFGQVPEWLIDALVARPVPANPKDRDGCTPAVAAFVFAALAAKYADYRTWTAEVTHGELAAAAGLSRRAVQRGLEVLVAVHAVCVEPRVGRNGWQKNRYHLHVDGPCAMGGASRCVAGAHPRAVGDASMGASPVAHFSERDISEGPSAAPFGRSGLAEVVPLPGLDVRRELPPGVAAWLHDRDGRLPAAVRTVRAAAERPGGSPRLPHDAGAVLGNGGPGEGGAAAGVDEDAGAAQGGGG